MIYPCIQVCDIESTISWYEHFLDFRCSYKSSIRQPDFAVLENGGLKIYVKEDPEKSSYASNIVVIETTDLEEKYKEIEKKGLIIIQPIFSGVFGNREFVAKDYEDNKIVFTENV